MIDIKELKAGESFQYTGLLIVMRDAAQNKLVEIKNSGKELPVSLREKIVFYAGPTFVSNKMIVGPTTSKRMDRFLEFLAQQGVQATIGKGARTHQAIEIIKEYKIPYFVAPSGCAAYLSQKVLSWKLLAFEDLGPEAIYEIKVTNFPLIVAIDSYGNTIFE